MKRRIYVALVLGMVVLPVSAPARNLGELTHFFQDVVVGPNDTAQDIVCIYCSIQASGNVSGELVAIGGEIEILGKVDGDAVAVGGHVKLGPGAEVRGDAVSLGGPLEVGPRAKVGGASSSNPWFYVPGQRGVRALGALMFIGLSLSVAVVLALILRAVRLENIAGAVRKRPGWTITAGLAVFVAWVLVMTVAEKFGRAEDIVANTASGFVGTVLAAGFAGLSLGVGAKLLPTRPPLVRVLAGSLVLALPQLVPLLGLAGFLAVVVVALGSSIVSGFGGDAEWLPARLRRRVAVPGTSKPAAS